MSDAVKLTAGAMHNGLFGDHVPFDLTGIVQTAAGSVVIYDGNDASGVPVLASSAVGTVAVNFPVSIRVGVFAVLTGGAAGSVLTG